MFERLLGWVKRVIGMFKRNTIKERLGVDVAVSGEMSRAVELWSKMYTGNAPWLSDTVRSLNLPSAVASELARLTTLEMVSEVTGSARADYINTQYQEVIGNIRRYTEYACAKGGMVLKPYLSDGGIAVGCIQADSFFPTAFDSSGNITGAMFVEQLIKGEKYYTRLEYHNLSGRTYAISNRAYRSDNASDLGSAIPLGSVPEWEGLQEDTTIANIDKPLFGYFKVPLANTIDNTSPLGVSVYARAVELIKQADKQYSRLLWEFESGERAVYIDMTAFKKDKDGKPVLPDKRLYRTLNIEQPNTKMYEDWSPEFRDASLLNGLNALLRKIEYNCGLAYGTLSDVQDVDKTAEEIRSSKQRSYSTVCDLQKALKTALEGLVYAMDIYCTLYKLCPAGSYEMSFEFDDSIVADRQAEFLEKQTLVGAGIMQPWEFRMWYFGESEEEAKRAVSGGDDQLHIGGDG